MARDLYSVHLLDMGLEMYGDSILVKSPHATILIDGGHLGDWQRRHEDYPSIPEQLRALLGLEDEERIEVDLLVVTHFHADHIGCLPRLVADEVLLPKRALLADPDLGSGRTDADRGEEALVGLDDATRAIALAMLEEDRSALTDAALREFVADAATQYERYGEMIRTLQGRCDVTLYSDRADGRAVESAFRALPLRVIGPTAQHLRICAQAIQKTLKRSRDAMEEVGRDLADSGEGLTIASVYRRLVSRVPAEDEPEAAADRPGKGAAINNQSIVLTIGEGDAATLLTGDMQLAEDETSGLARSMTALRRKLAGRYAVVKTPHHTSYNGIDEEVLDLFAGTPWYVHSGGLEDPTHPDPEALGLFYARRRDLKWARTDRNGLVSIRVLDDASVLVAKSRGRLNDRTPNTADTRRRPEQVEEGRLEPRPEPPAPSPAPETAPEVSVVQGDGERVKATVSVPYAAVRITLSLEVEPKGPPPARDDRRRPASTTSIRVGGDRAKPLPRLLFVTQRERLARNIGRSEAAEVVAAVEESHALLNLAEDVTTDEARAEVQRHGREVAGVVLLGGYDVVPSFVRDTITPDLRRALDSSIVEDDDDDFIVWNDDDYGEVGGRRYAVPVSRIPDGRSADLVRAALGSPRPATPARRTGIINCLRPFASKLFDRLPGTDRARVSEPHHAGDLTSAALAADVVYLMLHGAHWDGRSMWGDRRKGGLIEAVNVGNVSDTRGAVVFSGACWGALTVKSPAGLMRPNEQVSPKTPEASLPLTLLRAGANAFVGCTGLHYSPVKEPYRYFGGPLHEAFWGEHLAGHGPAEALRRAKISYLKGIGERSADPGVVAIELKILEQFTCLGLGW